MNPSRIARCRQVVIDAGVKSEVLIKTDDLQAVVEAAELALVLELKQQGVDALTAMSEERFWQGLCLRFTDLALEWPEEADRIVAEYLKRYGEKPEQPTAAVVRTVQRPESTPAVEVRAEQDPRPWVLKDGVFATWHNFRDGHRNRAVCGAPPIPGTPSVSEKMPSLNVCTICAAAVAEPQEERKGLEWEVSGAASGAASWAARFLLPGNRPYWVVYIRLETGLFFVKLINATSGEWIRHEAATLAEAKAWCQKQEDELLAQQEAEQEGKSDATDGS